MTMALKFQKIMRARLPERTFDTLLSCFLLRRIGSFKFFLNKLVEIFFRVICCVCVLTKSRSISVFLRPFVQGADGYLKVFRRLLARE